MLLGELIEAIGIRASKPSELSTRICDLTEDSRTVMPGSLFIARPGVKTDGRKYIDQALASDAAAILTVEGTSPPAHLGAAAWLTTSDIALAEARLAERFFGGPTSKLDLIGVTGTNGKTTITHLVHQMFNEANRRCGLIGTVSIDDGGGLAGASLTTPPALELSYTFAHMLEHGCRAAAIEVSSHALDQKRVAALEFDVAVFTNLTGDHLDYHGTMERYADAKARLFEMLGPEGTAIVNADDPAHERMLRACCARVLRCTATGRSGSQCLARSGAITREGTPVTLSGPWGAIEGHLRLIGGYNVMNCLQAVAAAHAAGLDRDSIALSLFQLRAPPGRLEPVRRGRDPEPFEVFVDYAHSDDSLAKALGALRPLVDHTGGRLRVVFGCGGDRDRTKRPRMARVAAELADHVIVTSDNPRTERPAAIIAEVLAGVERHAANSKVTTEEDRRSAIFRAVEASDPGDVLLIAGKGHEDYQLLPDGLGGIRKIDFDDRRVAREALVARFEPRRPAAEWAEGALP